MAFAICLELYKNYRNKISGPATLPANFFPHPSYRDTAKHMIRLVRTGHFRMHILSNDAALFNDGECMARYKTYIRNPSVIGYILNLKGGLDYE
jgi:hypothetical protein